MATPSPLRLVHVEILINPGIPCTGGGWRPGRAYKSEELREHIGQGLLRLCAASTP